MTLKLGATFETTPEFWLNAQKAVDIYRALRDGLDLPRPILSGLTRHGRGTESVPPVTGAVLRQSTVQRT